MPGTESAEFVISNDFFPTFTDLAGGISKEKDIDGVSLLPVLRDSGAKLTRESLCWHYPHYHGLGIAPSGAIRKGRYKLIEWFEKSAYGEDGAYELYDLMSDPGESRNLSSNMKDKTAELKKDFIGWKRKFMFLGHPNRRNSEAYILSEETNSLLGFFLFLRGCNFERIDLCIRTWNFQISRPKHSVDYQSYRIGISKIV